MTESDSREPLSAPPRYRDLPFVDKLGARHSWDYFGHGDQLGTLNWITDQKVLEGIGEVATGERIGVTLSSTAIDPPLYMRSPLVHTLIESDRNTWDDKFDEFYPQASSQWDGFRHVRAREFGFFGAVTGNPPDIGDQLGIQAWARKGIVTRGVLLDLERYFSAIEPEYDPMATRGVSGATLHDVARAQGVQIRQGDVLCLRFGWVTRYRNMSADERVDYAAHQLPPYAGLAADEELAGALWDMAVAGVVCDNPAAEISPGDPSIGSLHRRLIPLLGFAVGELWDLDELAERCAADDRWSFLVASVPMNFSGAVGSPANAVVIR